MSAHVGRIVVVRHGMTQWSSAGRHTGRTDIPLVPEGEVAAAALRGALAGLVDPLVLASPLQRAWRTAELAGFQPLPDPDLMEWDYGAWEGLTTDQIRTERRDEGWTIWDGPPAAGQSPGESVAQVAERCAAVLQRCAAPLAHGRDCVLFAHSHVLRILTVTWLGMDPTAARHLVLGPAHRGTLGRERECPALLGWNFPPGVPDVLVG